MAAISSLIMGTLSLGDHVLGGSQLYGRTLRLMREDLPRFGIQTSFADPTNIVSVKSEIRKNTKMILIECVSNPTLRVADIEGIANLCKRNNILLAVDNTFTTPACIKPFEYGADFVIHSITKLLSGHSDTTLGYVSSKDQKKMEAIYNFSVSIGTTPSPFDCWLAERGLATFELRFEKAQKNAEILAEALKKNRKIKKVLYPTMSEHPDISLAKQLLKGNGCNMVSFEIGDNRIDANKFIENIEGIAFAPTLGDIGTTISHPGSSSHRYLNLSARKELGISEGFFRVSVGLEDPDKIVGSIERALQAI
jgi:cystathionine gamma-synthase